MAAGVTRHRRVALHRQDHPAPVARIPGRIADVVVALRLGDARGDLLRDAGALMQGRGGSPHALEDADEEDLGFLGIGGEPLPVVGGHGARSGQEPLPRVGSAGGRSGSEHTRHGRGRAAQCARESADPCPCPHPVHLTPPRDCTSP